jgi:hypothetical protein
MQLTIFLAKLIGLFTIILSVFMLGAKKTAIDLVDGLINDRPALFVLELVGIAAGLAMVIGHNIWSGGALAIVVTLVGWLLLIRSIVWMALPQRTMKRIVKMVNLEKNYPVFTIVSLLLGAYLTYEGFSR